MSCTDGASEIYAKLLLLEKLGYPLWYPEPSEDASEMHRTSGVRIGDVGNITGVGQFEFYFNVHDEATDPSGWQVWNRGYEYSKPNVRSPGTVVKRGAVTQVSLKADLSTSAIGSIGLGSGVDITCSADDSAILVLPDGATSRDLRRIAEYLDNLTDDMTSRLLDRARSESVLLVTGYTKSCSWGVAAVSNTSKQGSLSLSFNATTKVGGNLTGSYEWQSTSDGHHREGPRPPSIADNQCVFVLGYNVRMQNNFVGKRKRRLADIANDKAPIPRRVKRNGEIAPGNHPSGNNTYEGCSRRRDAPADSEGQGAEDHDEFVVTALTDMSQRYHPADVVNEYLLKQVHTGHAVSLLF